MYLPSFFHAMFAKFIIFYYLSIYSVLILFVKFFKNAQLFKFAYIKN